MSSFVPLNIIPDSDSEAEVDNTEEIQIEEALKLYQRALRLHTDGTWEEARQAYDDLFRSDIFQLDVEEQVHARNRTVASSLPLVHYLSYKNHGTFKLDCLKQRISTASAEEVRSEVKQALEWFATALGRDGGDSSLWRETAQLALVLQSARLARYSLESLLDHNTVGADSAKDSLALVNDGMHNPEDYLALLQLHKVLEAVCDDIALSRPDMRRLAGKRASTKLAKALNPVSWLPNPPEGSQKSLKAEIDGLSQQMDVVSVDSRSWPAIGKALLERLSANVDVDELDDTLAGAVSVQIALPHDGEEESPGTSPDPESTPEAAERLEVAVADEIEDVTMMDASNVQSTETEDLHRGGSAGRKRKSTSMGVDSGRSRLSKRQRDKKEADEKAAAAAAATPEAKERIRQETQDEKLFNTVYDCFSPFGISLGTAAALKIKSTAEAQLDACLNTESIAEKSELYVEDFKSMLQSWDDDKGNVILYGDGIQSPAETAQGMKFLDLEANLPSRPLLVGDEGLRVYVKDVHSRGLSASEAAYEWLRALCRRQNSLRISKKRKSLPISAGTSSWIKHYWPDLLKSTVTNVACAIEDILWGHFKSVCHAISGCVGRTEAEFTSEDYAEVEWAETILEIYLDDLAAAERLRSGGDLSGDLEDELPIKCERVFRWAHLVGDLMQCRPRDGKGELEEDQLTLRYLWASALITGFSDPPREFRLACFEDLKEVLARHAPIGLPNCSIMPEVSSTRAEREISKLKTVDFFSTIFTITSNASEKDPEDVIDVLEAVLYPGAVIPYDEEEGRMLDEISRFLEGSSAMFRLHLWEKLRMAYERKSDIPKILSCTLKCMEVVLSELGSRSYAESTSDHRYFVLLRCLRIVETMTNHALALSLNFIGTIDQLDHDEIVGGLKSLMTLLKILHCYAFWETAVMKSEAKASDLHSYRLVVAKFRELLVRTWVLVYHLFSALLRKGRGEWDESQQNEKLAGLLRDLHEELGQRHYCKLASHLFLRVQYNELMRFNNRDFDGELLQCIQCRFHMQLCADKYYLYDHRTDPETLTRDEALQLIDFLLYLCSSKKLPQLQRSDLKSGLDRVVEVLGFPKRHATIRIAHNEAAIDQYLRSSIHPLRLFQCLKGDLTLSTVDVLGEYQHIASKGLYFLMGKIHLYPIKSQKKNGAVRNDGLDTTHQYFKNDLVCRPESWETWYRVAQTYETQMEDAQTWTADAINSRREDLVRVERKCILSYMMAVSLAVSHADNSPETSATMSELFTDFGYRLYSAANPPMKMESFGVADFKRYYSGRHGEGMWVGPQHSEVAFLDILKFTLRVFQNALAYGGEGLWKNHYMMGKVMAKIHKASPTPDHDKGVGPEEVAERLVEAVSRCPEKNGNDYIFEPHYKLLSQLTKFVQEGEMKPRRAFEVMQVSHFVKRGDDMPEDAQGINDFVPYALELLRRMKVADKPKWHHRMTDKIARLKYQFQNDIVGARAEYAGLFSNKQAQLSIWKPEFERPGRYFIYAAEYTRFFSEILRNLGDRATLEILAKRVRKLHNGIAKHAETWGRVFDDYMELLVKQGGIRANHEETTFKNVSFEEFTLHSGQLDTYCHMKTSEIEGLALLREVYELRKLNAALSKNTRIDDVFANCYAKLYEEVVPEIVQQMESRQNNPMNLKNIVSADTAERDGELSGVGKTEDLPMRGKISKVTRREVISKASNLCKDLGLVQAVGTKEKATPSTAPSSPKVKAARSDSPNDSAANSNGMVIEQEEDLAMIQETEQEQEQEQEQEGDSMMADSEGED